MNIRLLLCFYGILFVAVPVQAMVYDNRYFPLYARTYTRTKDKPSSFFADLMIMTSGSGTLNADDEVTIPGLFGEFDQRNLARAIAAHGKPNKLPGIDEDLIWRIRGKIQTEGVAFAWNQHIYKYFSCGMSWFVMHVMSRQLFKPILGTSQLEKNGLEKLDAALRAMLEEIGITGTQWDASGMSDIDCYLRAGNIWEYPYKFRRIDAGIRLGLIIPTGLTRDINNPASVPFGGNGHWGFYVSVDAEFEVKEDWSVGLLARVTERFDKTSLQRLPVAQKKQEHVLYGAIVAPVETEPGSSYAFAPYLRVEDLRDGLGFMVGYTVAVHENDTFFDRRPRHIPLSNVTELQNASDWMQEYVTVNLYYDFAKVKNADDFKPVVSCMWDFPVGYLIAHKVPKTHRISVGIELDF